MAILSDAQVQDLKNQWNNLSYDQQQAKLKANSGLQGALTNLGLTAKSNPNDSIINSSQVAKNTGNYTQQGTNFTIGGQTVGASEGSKPNANGTVVGGYTTPQGGSVLQDASPVDPFSSNSTGPKSILDKPTNNVTNFSVLGINPYGQQTTQKGNNTTNRTSVSTPKNKGYTAPKQAEWDYQDNSQARMNQIADNLDRYTITNPELFKDYDGFYNFFIAGKGRSEDQKRFLDQYYADYKKNEKYNNMSPDEIGVGIANGTVPEDYLNYIKNKDPQRYNDIMLAKKDREDSIRNEGGLQTIVETMGDINSNTDNISWQKKAEIRMDEDDNGIDDRREHYATEEEQGYQKQIADLNARNLEIDNAIKNTYDELRDRYPGASKSTLMAMANDRNSDIMREKENNLVELTRLQGYVNYMQAERKEMNEAGDNSIRQLQDNLKLYYTYSPAGMKELADAQYEAAHPTLDKAENGTDTEKARAIESILQGYYDKYGDIIQRPMEQAIQDVIAEAKASGKSLYDALKDNFITPLRAKPQFDTISAGGSANGSWTLEAIKDSEGNIVGYVKIDKNTGTVEGVEGFTSGIGGNGEGGYTEGNNGQFTNYTPVSQRDMVQGLKDFMNSFVDENGYLTGKGGQCGHFVNDYLEKIGIGRLYTDPIDKKKAITNTNVPAIGAVAVMGSKTSPQYGHVAIVGKVNKDGTLNLLESNWGGDEKIHIRENVDPSKANIYGYFNPSIAPSEVGNQYGYGENPMSNLITKLYSSKDINADQKKDLKFADQAYGIMYDLASNGDIDYLLKSSSGQKMLANLKNSKFIQNDSDATGTQVMDALKNGVTDQRNLRTVNRLINLIELKLRKTSGAAIAASEWNTNFSQLLPGVGESYDTAKDKYTSFEKDYLMAYFNSVGGGKKGYKYEALFSPNSPYYKKYNPSKTSLTSTDNNKGTWSLGGVNNTQINNYDDLYYYMGI